MPRSIAQQLGIGHKLGSVGARLGQNRPTLGRFRPNLGRSRPTLTDNLNRLRANLAKSRRLPTDVGPTCLADKAKQHCTNESSLHNLGTPNVDPQKKNNLGTANVG